MKDKAKSLMGYVDLKRPELDRARKASKPAVVFVEHLADRRIGKFRFEYWKKEEILSYLKTNYAAWRKFNTKAADRLCKFTIKQAQRARALGGVATMGQAWWATGDPKYGAAFERFYLSVPTGKMFNWGSFNGSQGSLELNAWFLLQDCPGFSPEGRIAFLDHLCAITDDAWDDETSQWRQLMLGPEGHNWYLHGMHILPFLGLLFPEFKRAEFFYKTGWSVVEEHMRGHYKSDGGARETTLGYQAGSMLCMWDFYLIAKRNKRPISVGFEERMLNATKFLMRLMTPKGCLPSYGDTGPSSNLADLASVATALTGDRECKWYAEYARKRGCVRGEKSGSIPLSSFWRVGLEGAAKYERTKPLDPRHVSVLMGPTGYVAMRNSDKVRASYMAIAAADRGPIVTSHGHNEIFSIEVQAGGTRFIGEMGCASYGDTPGRDYDQTTAAHSTVGVDGLEQVPIASEWRWNGRVSPVVRRWISEDTHDFFHGVHEGYFDYRKHDTLHGRKVFFVKSRPGGMGYWVVMDWLESQQKNKYRAYFHGCVPGAISGKSIVLGKKGGTQLVVMAPAGDKVVLKKEESKGLSAYISEKKLNAEEYPCFSYSKRASDDCLVSVIVPLAHGERRPSVKRLAVTLNGLKEDPHGATAVAVKFGTYTDSLCVSHKEFDGEMQFGGYSAEGIIAFRRQNRRGRVLQSIDHSVVDGICGR